MQDNYLIPVRNQRSMELRLLSYDELDKDLLYDILAVRSEEFVVKEGCVYHDPDGFDREALHLICTDNGEIVGYLRILKRGLTFEEASVGRVLAVRKRSGIGRLLMEYAMRYVDDVMHEDTLRIEAQVQAIGFYEKFGFRTVSGEFLEAGIPHVQMVRKRES